MPAKPGVREEEPDPIKREGKKEGVVQKEKEVSS